MPGVRKVPGRSGGEPTRPIDAATWCLIALVIAGVALRVVTEVGWWPTATTLADSSAYARFAESNPFADPQHPAGYALILAAIGSVTREVAVPVVLQHLAGIASALLLYAATRRVTGSRWAGLLPAAIVLLNPDEILLEHAIMAESWAILATAGGLYATVRAFDEPVPLWRWPLLAGVLLAVSVTIRTAGLATIAVVLLGLLLAGRGRWRDRARWATPLAAGGGAVAILVAFAIGNSAFGPRLGIGPSPGWYLYARAAQFADCSGSPRRRARRPCASRPRPTSAAVPATTSSIPRRRRRGCSAPSPIRPTARPTSSSAAGPSAPCWRSRSTTPSPCGRTSAPTGCPA